MIMIRGTDITLFAPDGTAETVTNVLIGEPADSGREYTLGIPKGDTHDWLDRRTAFFGRQWRTIGIPDEGIEANIPLCWHKKVHVRQLVTTGSVTVYEAENYTRHVFGLAEFCSLRGVKVSAAVMQSEGDVAVHLWSCGVSDGYVPKAGDLIVNGEQGFEFDMTTAQTASASMAVFREQFPEFAAVRSVSAELNGEKYDYTITAG